VCTTGVGHACSLFGARLLSCVIRSRLAARAALSSSSRYPLHYDEAAAKASRFGEMVV